MVKKDYALTLDSDAFNALKGDFNQILRSTLNNMLQKEGEKAEVKVSLKITLTDGTAPDTQESKYEAERGIIIPMFEHKVSSVMQYKAEVSGITGGAEYELVWDKDAVAFVMRPIKSNQIDMFEYSDQGDYQYEGSEDDAEA